MTLPDRPVLAEDPHATIAPRIPERLVQLAQELQSYNGYMDHALLQQRNIVLEKFNGERRKFIYDTVRWPGTREQKLAVINANVDSIAETTGYSSVAIEFLREDIVKRLTRQSGQGGVRHFAARYGPPAASVFIFLLSIGFLGYRAIHDGPLCLLPGVCS